MIEELKDKELFQSIFKFSIEGILVVDSQGMILKANPASENIFEYDAGELINKKIETLIPKKFKENQGIYKYIYFRGTKVQPMRKEINLLGLKKKGSQFALQTSHSSTVINGKQVIIIFLINTFKVDDTSFLTVVNDIETRKKDDITERKKALIKSEQKLRNYAIELEEKVQERTDELTATVQKLVEANLNLEDQILITKTAENKAIVNQNLLSAIAKNFPKGIIIVINSDYKIEYIEGQELKKIGLKEKILEGLNIDEIDVFSKNQKIRLKQDIRKTLAGEHLSFEIDYKDITYLVNTTPLFDDNKKIIEALLVYSDISEQKQVELKTLNALRKEQELNELKSRFISMASHEFKTPLSTILSSAFLIEKLNGPGKEEKREKYTNKIKNNVRNLVAILNDFLSLSKMEEGKMSVQPEYFELIDFSKSLIEELETNKKEGQVITIINDCPSIKVNLDPKLTRHILLNLVSNAIKYSPENKEITLKISSNSERIFLEVSDQGIGIPEVEQINLFDRFFRAENASNIQGTGLGLYIVKQYAELLNGTINFKSKLSEGSTFIVELPINQKKNEKSIID